MKSLRLACILVLSGALAFGSSSKISPDLQPYTLSLAKVNVIVQFNQTLTPNLLNSVVSLGATLLGELPLINSALYSISGTTLNLVAALPGVKYMTPDRLSNSMLDYSQPTINANIGLQYGWDGRNIGIAVIDSGITPVADLNYAGSSKSRVVYSQNFSDSTTNTSDQFGHGTHVAGILAGNGANSTGSGYTHTFLGIAPRAQLINLRVLNSKGQGNDSAVIQALSQAIQLKSQYNIRIVNLSLGRGIFESYTQDPLCQAAEQAWKAGLVVVVAAGNYGRDNSQNTNGYARITSPGNDPYVITVGAMKTMSTTSRADDLIASYSSKGPTLLDHIVKPDIVAPGNRTISLLAPNGSIDTTYPQNVVPYTYYKNTSTSNSSSSYFRLSGTSMATPMVSAAAALLLQQSTSLTPDQVKARLMKTASKSFPSQSTVYDASTGMTYTSQYDIFTIGAGYLDVWTALNNTDLSTLPAMSPTARFDSSSGNVYAVSGTNVVWGSGDVWGGNVVWGSSVWVNGTNVVWGSSALWGSNVVWGSTTTSGGNVIWGSNVVWGSTGGTASLNLMINGEN